MTTENPDFDAAELRQKAKQATLRLIANWTKAERPSDVLAGHMLAASIAILDNAEGADHVSAVLKGFAAKREKPFLGADIHERLAADDSPDPVLAVAERLVEKALAAWAEQGLPVDAMALVFVSAAVSIRRETIGDNAVAAELRDVADQIDQLGPRQLDS